LPNPKTQALLALLKARLVSWAGRRPRAGGRIASKTKQGGESAIQIRLSNDVGWVNIGLALNQLISKAHFTEDMTSRSRQGSGRGEAHTVSKLQSRCHS
jgi:hypothetical protein